MTTGSRQKGGDMVQAVPRRGLPTSQGRGASCLMQGIFVSASLALCAYSMVLLTNDEAPAYPLRTYGALGGAGLLLALHGFLILKWRAVIIRYRTKTLAFPFVQHASLQIPSSGCLRHYTLWLLDQRQFYRVAFIVDLAHPAPFPFRASLIWARSSRA
jgi:hypothetical protein